MPPGTDAGYEGIKLVLDVDVIDLMESRGILQDEVKMVIQEAETSGVKLFKPDGDEFLAKKRIMDTTYFVEYRPASDDSFEVITAYCCKSEIL